jgi:alkylation response protein AidB-like acyl-CoA dehydrogenase
VFSRQFIERVRNASSAIEKAGRLPDFVMEFIYKEKLFKLFVPRSERGKMLPLPEALRVFDESAYMDGNLGWAITIGSGGGYFYAYMQAKTAHQVFSNKKAVVAGSGHPSATADRVKGGYKVTGQWKYASGAPYATVFTANAMIKGGGMKAFAFLPEQVSIIKDWNAFGMKATESYSFKVNKAFVADEMTFDLSNKKLFYEAPLYKYPFLQFAESSFAALVIGLGRHFIEEAIKIIEDNKGIWPSERHKFVKAKLQMAQKNIGKAIKDFYEVTDKSWAQLVKINELQFKLQNEVSKTSKQTSKTILTNADGLFQYMGMQAVMGNSTINQVWRDLHTASQHILLVSFEK